MRNGLLATSVCLTGLVVGCGGTYATVSVNAAQARLDQARELGAESAAPYEYYAARYHLHDARTYAAGTSYSEAARHAETAEMVAQKAMDLTRASKNP